MLPFLTTALFLPADNTLTAQERRAGWRLMFDGKTTAGWHNFKAKGVRPGWKVQDGVLTSVDPPNAGDIVSDGMYDWFELTLDFRLTKGGNSGIMFRVSDSGEQTWHSGPEVQIYDHPEEPGVEISGYLYQLYPGPFDTHPPKDASHPAGEWNHLRILVSPKKCETDLNGSKYYEYVYGSEDFWDRVKRSKFAEHPEFAKSSIGRIGIQGDHGVVSFKNIKIRRIRA